MGPFKEEAGESDAWWCARGPGALPNGGVRLPGDPHSNCSYLGPCSFLKTVHGDNPEGEKQKHNHQFTYFLSNIDNSGDSPRVKFGNNFIFTSEFTTTGPDLEFLDASLPPPLPVCISCLPYAHSQTSDQG